ncbi:response regulator [Microvirga terricola]|uniref:Response regulator n=1 Tax=Microvirga terricola TaxID=2719797 RepID=A0ABX0V7M5_9HYPH|nr:response regulator [Microvirga terricola]NIX75191.1 response regulator [Microvirga terricola]
MPLLPFTLKLALALSSCALIFSGLALAGAAFSRQPEWIAMSGLLFALAVLWGGVSLGRRIKELLREQEERAANRSRPEAEPFPALEKPAPRMHSEGPTPVPAKASGEAGDEQSARRVQKLEMLERLREGIVHDLNNKLLVISANIDSVARHLKDQPALQRKLLSALVASDQAASLIARSNAFARGQDGDVRCVDLAERIESIATLMNRSLLRDTVELRVSLESDLWPVQVDPSDLEMAIMTLSAYVRDALHQGGTITIEARNAQVQKGSLSNLAIEGDFVQLVIASTGTDEPQLGLDEQGEQAFTLRDMDLDAWLTLNRGLRFLHPLGGTAEVRNIAYGLAITLYLPRADAPVEMLPGALRDEFGESETVRTHTEVLVIDDEVDVALALQAMLEEVGYVTRIATDARQVMKTLKARKPGLVLTDVAMHGTMNGVMLAREIRQAFPDLPVLLITGNPSAMEEEKEFLLLLKPIVSRDLHAAIQRQLAPPEENNVVSLFPRPSRRSS